NVEIVLRAIERMAKLEGDARAAEAAAWVVFRLPLRIDHGIGMGQIAVNTVVVGDDEVDTQLLCAVGGGIGAHAIVDGHDEMNTRFGSFIDVAGTDAVALKNPIRHAAV